MISVHVEVVRNTKSVTERGSSMNTKRTKLIVTVPTSHADVVRDAIGVAGGGVVGNYTFCSFSTKGIGRFKPMKGAQPAIGSVGALESVEEEKIEITCDSAQVGVIVSAIKKVHPYEEVTIDLYQIETPIN